MGLIDRVKRLFGGSDGAGEDASAGTGDPDDAPGTGTDAETGTDPWDAPGTGTDTETGGTDPAATETETGPDDATRTETGTTDPGDATGTETGTTDPGDATEAETTGSVVGSPDTEREVDSALGDVDVDADVGEPLETDPDLFGGDADGEETADAPERAGETADLEGASLSPDDASVTRTEAVDEETVETLNAVEERADPDDPDPAPGEATDADEDDTD